MKYPFQEKGAHASVDEFSRSSEFGKQREFPSTPEWQREEEQFPSEEHSTPRPQNERKKGNEETKRNAALLSQYAVGAAALAVVAAVGIGAAALPPPIAPIFTVQEQSVGLDFFHCALRLQNADALTLTARLFSSDGELLEEIPLNGEQIPLRFEGLYPEREYAVSVADSEGEERFAYEFTTEPFATFTEENGKWSFALHPSISLALDVGLHLYDAEGKDFSSNIYFDPLAVNYLFLDGLYQNEYVFTMISYPMEENAEPLVYEKVLTLGSLAPLAFTPTIDYESGELILQYLAGDTAPYQEFDVSFQQDNAYYSVSSEEVRTDGGDFYIPLPANMPEGSYRVALGGAFTAEEINFWNEIWIDEITY